MCVSERAQCAKEKMHGELGRGSRLHVLNIKAVQDIETVELITKYKNLHPKKLDFLFLPVYIFSL